MLPIGVSAPPLQRRPWLTVALVALLLLVFLRVVLLRDAPQALFCTDLTESERALRESADTVQGFVCRWAAVPDDLRRGARPWTLVSAAFVHTSLWHLVPNVLFLGAFAPRVEEDLRPLGLLALFLGTAVAGGLVHVLVVPLSTDPTIGASGGVAGVLGAHLLLGRGASVRVLVGPVPVRLPTWFVLCLWAGLQVVYTALALRRAEYPGGVSYEVHAAAFAVGALVTALVLRVHPHVRHWPPAQPAG